MDCSLLGSSVRGIFLARKNTRAGCHFLLQGIFLTLGSNPCLFHLMHWQVDSLPLCHLGSSYVSVRTSFMNKQLAIQHMHCHPPVGVSKPCHAIQDFFTSLNYPVVCSIWHYQNSKLNFPRNFNDLVELLGHWVHRKLSGTKHTKPLMALTPEVVTGELKGTFSILDYTLSVSVDNLSTGMLVSCNLKYLKQPNLWM